MNTKQRIKALEKELAALKKDTTQRKHDPVERCIEWVKKKIDPTVKVTSRVKSTYKRANGTVNKAVDVHFSNGMTFRVGQFKFWKVG